MDIMCPSKMSSGDGANIVINIRVINSWKKKNISSAPGDKNQSKHQDCSGTIVHQIN